MNIWRDGYNKPKIVSIMEQIYDFKGKKETAELQLSSEQFHYTYIPKRKDLMSGEAATTGILIILLTSILIPVIAVFLEVVMEPGPASGSTEMLSYVFMIAFGGYADVRLCMKEIPLLIKLSISFREEHSLRFSNKLGIETLQSDEIKTKQRIEFLKEQIASYTESIQKLEEQRDAILEEQKQREEVLKSKGVLFDEKPSQIDSSGKFVLKEDANAYDNSADLFEYYCKEEEYIRSSLFRIDGKIQKVEKDIVDIDDAFNTTKKQMIIFLFVIIIVAIIQNSFTGVLAFLTNLMCFICGLYAVFYFEKRCRKSILFYLIEHDSKLTSEYAFINDIYPVKRKREELFEKKDNLEKELTQIKEKKAKLNFS